MSQAEKQILRYLATMQQAKVAMGDLANTIESPSNQLKVFKQQLVEAKTAFTSLFIGGFASIMPYANALLMVIKEVSKSIADMFGIKLVDYNSGIASSEDAFVDLGDSVDDTIGKVKELKRQTLGFDEIHNINEDNDSGSGSSITGGIDQRLLDAIHGYDNGMDKVRMKATEIRDRIMEWLGFTKEIDPLTGEVGFKLKDGETRFKGILDFVKNIKDVAIFALEHADTIIKTIIGYKLIKKLGDVLTTLTTIKSVINTTKFGAFATSLAGAFGVAELVSSTDWYQNLTGNQGDMVSMIGKIISGENELDETRNSNKLNDKYLFYKNIALYSKSKELGYQNVMDRTQTYLEENNKPGNFREYILGKVYGKDKLNMAFEEYNQNKELYDQLFFGESMFNNDGTNIEDYTNSLQKYFDTINTNYINVSNYNKIIEDSKTAYQGASEQIGILLSQMSTDQYKITAEDIATINSNLEQMRISSANASQAQVDGITKIMVGYQQQGLASSELVKQIISDAQKKKLAEQGYTEEFINKISELNTKFSEGKITDEEYTTSMIEIYNQYDKTTSIVDQKKEVFNALSSNLDITANSFDDLKENIKTMSSSYTDGITEIETSSNSNLSFLSQYVAEVKSKYGEESEEYKRATEAMKLENENKKIALEDMNNNYAIYLNNILQQLVNSKEWGSEESYEMFNIINGELKKIGKGVDADVKDNLNLIKDKIATNGDEIKENVAINLLETKGKITEATPDIVDAFGVLSQTSKDKFKEKFAELPEDVQQQVVDKMHEKGYSISNELQKGIKEINPTITVNADTSNASWQIDDLISNIKWKFQNPFSIIAGLRANGGVYSNGSWKDIPQYANGGAPSHGTVFVGGENGPEIVGHINGRTEILNQSQIASSIYSAVVSAMTQVMSQYGGQASQVDVRVHSDGSVVVDEINQVTRQTGVCPINIPTY